jgi:hypothetical protein
MSNKHDNSRGTCAVEGCSKKTTHKKLRKDGTYSWRIRCWTHERDKTPYPGQPPAREKNKKGSMFRVLASELGACVKCGWDKVSCDKHRLVPGCQGGKYEKDNIVMLCPNCHRMAHYGILELTHKDTLLWL